MLGPQLNGDASAELHHVVDGWWTALSTGDGTIIPDGAVDLMWCSGRTPWIAGPDTAPRSVNLDQGTQVLGLRLQPGAAQTLLQDSVATAKNRAVLITDIWNNAAVDHLVADLECATSIEQRAQTLARAAAERLPADWRPDPTLMQALRQIRQGQPVHIDGLSDRQLRRRFTHAMGYGPAFYRRIARLDRFTDLLAQAPNLSNAELAATAGYFDEAHLWRDATALTGAPPSQLRA